MDMQRIVDALATAEYYKALANEDPDRLLELLQRLSGHDWTIAASYLETYGPHYKDVVECVISQIEHGATRIWGRAACDLAIQSPQAFGVVAALQELSTDDTSAKVREMATKILQSLHTHEKGDTDGKRH
jgi:hypothetical protein